MLGSAQGAVRRRTGSCDRRVVDDGGEKDKSATRVIRLQGYAVAALGVLALVAVLTPAEVFMGARALGAAAVGFLPRTYSTPMARLVPGSNSSRETTQRVRTVTDGGRRPGRGKGALTAGLGRPH